MAALSILAKPKVSSDTLSGTASRPRIVKVYHTGRLNIFSTSALEINHDTAVVDNTTDMSSVVGWPIPASAGYAYDITNIDHGLGYHQVNVWGAAGSEVVVYHLTDVK